MNDAMSICVKFAIAYVAKAVVYFDSHKLEIYISITRNLNCKSNKI